jgi:predicted PurR-regulated permease PerM
LQAASDLPSPTVSHGRDHRTMLRPTSLVSAPGDGGVTQTLATIVVAVIIVGVLYAGRDVFIPIALAILLSFVLAPLVRLLQSWWIPRGLSVVTVVFLAFVAIFALGGLIAVQVTQLAGELPRYQLTIQDKIRSLRATSGISDPLDRAAEVLKELNKEINRPAGMNQGALRRGAAAEQDSKPVPVEIRQPPPGPLESLSTLISPLLHPLATTGIVVVFVIFILLQREDLRNRVIKLAGSHDLQKTTAALDDAGRRLSRLFVTQLAFNTTFGVVIAAGLWFIGVPSAVLWGILSGVLRFVPYLGAFIAAIFPLTLALAVDPGWTMLLMTGALFLVAEPLVGHVIEPLVYGHSIGLSPVAVVVSATFWTLLWGPVGLVLATPITICLVVMGRHVERLEFLHVLLGDEPPLSPPEMFYQRMLAGDPVEEAERAEKLLKEQPLASYYDAVALKGLKLAQYDLARGALDDERVEKIKATVFELIEDLTDDDEPVPERADDAKRSEAAAEAASGAGRQTASREGSEHDVGPRARGALLCVAARSGLDEAAAGMLVQLLGRCGLGARLEGATAHSASNIFRLDTSNVAVVCVSCLDDASPAHIRYVVRRLRRKMPSAVILLGCWLADAATELAATVKADGAAATLSEAVERCRDAIRRSVIPTHDAATHEVGQDAAGDTPRGAPFSPLPAADPPTITKGAEA